MLRRMTILEKKEEVLLSSRTPPTLNLLDNFCLSLPQMTKDGVRKRGEVMMMGN